MKVPFFDLRVTNPNLKRELLVAFNKVTDESAPFKNLNEDAYQKNKMIFGGTVW